MTEETYYQRNKEKCLAQSKAYLAANREKYKEYHRAYYQLNKEKRNEARRLSDFKQKLKRKEQQKAVRDKKKIVFYETKADPVTEPPPVLTCEEELPRWTLFRSPGVTLTFE
jgi:hypothetical protein